MGLSNENNHFSKMTASEQWNYGDGQRGILSSIKKCIVGYERAACSSFDYDFTHHAQDRLLHNDLLTKNIIFPENWTQCRRIFIIGFDLSALDLKSPITRQGLRDRILLRLSQCAYFKKYGTYEYWQKML